MYDIEKALQPTIRMLMYAAEGVRIFLVGDRERLWIEGLPAGWEALSDFLLQAFEDETLPRRIMAGETGMNGVSIHPTNEVSSNDPRYQRWQEQLGLTGSEDPPLEFVRITVEGSSALLLMPMNAFHEWPIDWSNYYEYWQEDRIIGELWLKHGLSATRMLQLWSAKDIEKVEKQARAVNRMDPKLPATHTAMNEAEFQMALHPVFAPDDGGHMVLELMQRKMPIIAHHREAALALMAHAAVIPGAALPECTMPIASPISLQWFRLGPFVSNNMSVVEFLNFGMRSHMDRTTFPPDSGWISVNQSTGHSGVYYVKIGQAALAQLYLSTTRVGSTADSERIDIAAATASKAGHTQIARLLASAGLIIEPDRAQTWVELGMGYWYEGRRDIGIACLNHADTCNPSYNLSRFIRSMRSEAPTAAPLPSNAATELLQDALVGAADAWLRLPRANQLSQIWLRSLLRMPQLEPFWIELFERLKPFYMAREILRGLTPKTRKAVIARQPEELQAILNAHCSSKWDFA